jgi:hypothetical protein
MWQELVTILTKLSENYTKLLQLSREKHTALITVDLSMLEVLLHKEEENVSRIQTLESKRRELVIDLSKQYIDIRSDSRMSDLYAHASKNLQPILQQCHQDLSVLLMKVQETSDNNTILITGALSAVHYQLNRLGQSVVEPAYGTHGQEVVSLKKKFDFLA